MTRSLEDEILLPGLDVRILQHFEPSDTVELQPGDALYLPPRVAHHGVSTSADCLTYSMGFRAPSRSELLLSFAAHAARNLAEDDRFTDGDLPPVASAARRAAIEPHTTRRVRELLREAISCVLDDDDAFEAWVGEPLTARARALGSKAADADAARRAREGGAATATDDGVGGSEGPDELGPAARQAMAEWIRELEGDIEGDDDTQPGPDDGSDAAAAAALKAELEAELEGLMESEGGGGAEEGTEEKEREADDDDEEEDDHDEEEEEDDEGGSRGSLGAPPPSELIAAILAGGAGAPSLRLCEGAALAFVEHSGSAGTAAAAADDGEAAAAEDDATPGAFAPGDVVRLRGQAHPTDDGLRGVVAEVGERGCTVRLMNEGNRPRFFAFAQLELAVKAEAREAAPPPRPTPPPRASIFVNGERVATLVEATAVAHLPLLCASSRVDAAVLAAPLRESAELQQLVDALVRRDVFWVEVSPQ